MRLCYTSGVSLSSLDSESNAFQIKSSLNFICFSIAAIKLERLWDGHCMNKLNKNKLIYIKIY